MRFSSRTARRLGAACTCLALATLMAGPAAAQERSQWTFTAFLGTTDEGPGTQIHADFIAREFMPDETCFGLSCPGEMTETGIGASGYPFLLEFRFAPVRWAGVSAMAGRTEIGRTQGTRLAPTQQYLRLRYEADVVAGVVWLASPGDWVRVGVGPAWYRSRITREDYARASEDTEATVVRPIYEGSVSIPVRGPVRVEARAQYRPIGTMEYGPYRAGQFIPNPVVIYDTAVTDFSHWFFGAGVSVGL